MLLSKNCAVCGSPFEKKATESKTTWEKRQCCSMACGHAIKRGRPNPKLGDHLRGRKQPPETVTARSASMKRAHAEGRAHVIDTAGLRGEGTSQWKGDDVQYRAAHTRLRSMRGAPGLCAQCGNDAQEWALKHDARLTKIQETGPRAGIAYSPDPADYISLCCSCHRDYDGRVRDGQGRYS